MAEELPRREHMLELRAALFDEMEVAEREFSRVRLLVERQESDLRIGLPEPADYQHTKGRLLPQAESRVLDLFRDLLKLEDKINLTRR